MVKDPKDATSTTSKTPTDGGAPEHASGLRPWQDQSVPTQERLELYKALVSEKLEAIRSAFDRAREAQDVATQKEIMNSAETKEWMDEGAWLQTASAEAFYERIDRPWIMRALLGKNFLGAEAWRAQGIDVGEEPPIPHAITESLLESDCPLNPGKKIKDTHLLVLVPETVNGEPYSARKLDELCAVRQGSGDDLIFSFEQWSIEWKSLPWAVAPQSVSEWILLPKSDPDGTKVPVEKRFDWQSVQVQQQIHEEYYKDYREVKAIELMTAALLDDLMNGEPRMFEEFSYLRCIEPNPCGGRVIVGHFSTDGLVIDCTNDQGNKDNIGRALARKL